MSMRWIAYMAGKYRPVVWSFVGLAAMIVVVSLFLGTRVSPLCYMGIFGLAPLGFAGYRLHVRRTTERQREELRRGWAREVERDRHFDRLERAFQQLRGAAVPENALDENTWTDLNMDLVYARLDRTLTLPGEALLYTLLRCPETEEAALLERNRFTRLFQRDETLRASVRLELYRLGRVDHTDITGLLWGPRAVKPAIGAFFVPLTVLAVLSTCGVAVWGFAALVFGVLPVFFINLVITHWLGRAKVYSQINALRYLGAMIGRAQTIGARNHAELPEIATELKALAAQAGHIARRTRLLRPERGMSVEFADIVYEYISSLFLIEVRTFYGVQDELARQIQPLRRLYELLGTLDACQSVASFREELPCYAEPQFAAGNGACLDIEECCHPLLSEPVPNTLAPKSPGVFISGSNMSGKSTFLRSVAVNAILAQTIYTCYARRYRASFFRILSSINHADELEEGKSYYLVEAERLLRIVRAVEGARPCLCVVDELLRGTNAAERTSASAAILEYLCEQNALVLVASHDTDLAHTVSDRIEHYHFTDRFEDGRLHFDYRLKKGLATTRNAIRVLQALGYPAEIIGAARARFDRMS